MFEIRIRFSKKVVTIEWQTITAIFTFTGTLPTILKKNIQFFICLSSETTSLTVHQPHIPTPIFLLTP